MPSTNAAPRNPSRQSSSASRQGQDTIAAGVLRTVQAHTMYDDTQLSLDGYLEGDLGIDSVVLSTILRSLREEYTLSEAMLKAAPETIRGLINLVKSELGMTPLDGEVTPSAERPRGVATGVDATVWERLIGAIGCRFPQSVALDQDTHLLGELGIDEASERALSEDIATAFGLKRNLQLFAGCVTLGDVATRLNAVLGGPGGADEGVRASDNRTTKELEPTVGCTPTTHDSKSTELRERISSILQRQSDAAAGGTWAQQGDFARDRTKTVKALQQEFNVPSVLRLETCGSLDQLVGYVAAAGPEIARPGQKVATQLRDAAWDGRTMKDFVESSDKDLFAKARSFAEFFHQREQEHLYWYGMPLETPCRNRAVIFDELTGRRREFLMFASNNYLGLANHPHVLDAICDATRRFGATNTGCRIIGGTNVLHKELERRLARFKGREACIVYPSGYSANLGCISALVKAKDAVVVDKLNHMSIVDGCRLSGASRRIFKHNDMADLELVLQRARQQANGVLIAVDGVFSMHGNICNLPQIVRLAAQYGAKVLVDDAHATGVLGERGSGTAEHFSLKGEVDLELGTMSKALGGLGGFVCGDAEVIEYLRFYSNSYVYAATIPAGVAAGLIAAIDVIESEPERLLRLWQNIRRLSCLLLNAGFDLGGASSAIVPVVIGDDRKTLEMGRAVRARGLFCQTVVYPGVSVGDGRLRVSVLSEHSDEDIDLAASIIMDARRELGLAA